VVLIPRPADPLGIGFESRVEQESRHTTFAKKRGTAQDVSGTGKRANPFSNMVKDRGGNRF